MFDLEAIAEIITDSIAAESKWADGTLAEALRLAAWEAMEEFPSIKARDFGDAAASLDLHRQGAINRFNEAKKNFAEAMGE